MKSKGNAAIGGQILVPDAGPSANWLNWCFVSNHLSNSRNQYEMFSSPLFEVVLPVLWAKYYFFNCFITLDSLEWCFQYFYCEKQSKNPSKTTFFVWDIVNEWTSGTWICPPNAAFPIFTLDAPSSVIYNLYGHNRVKFLF